MLHKFVDKCVIFQINLAQEYRHSLDCEDAKNLTYPTLALAKIVPFDDEDPSMLGGLVKVTSMPSLRWVTNLIKNFGYVFKISKCFPRDYIWNPYYIDPWSSMFVT